MTTKKPEKTPPPTPLPTRIFVKRENDSDTPYLVADEEAQTMEDGDTVGIYELRETRTMRVTHTLE